MAIVSFWSNTRKETAQTLSMIALASYISVENNNRILIVDVNLNDKTIKNAFWTDKQEETKKMVKSMSDGKLDIGSGIEGLSKLLVSGKNSGEIITDYASIVYKGRLEAMLSLISDVQDDIDRVRSVYIDLIKLASQQYDYVFVDVPKTFQDPLTTPILEMSDVVVYNITQRLRDMDEYMAEKANNPLFKKDKVLPLIGRYDRFSKYTKKNIARYIGDKKDIPAVSYNTLFFEAASEGEIGNFFLKFRKSLLSNQDRNIAFVDEVANAAQRLIYKTQEVLMMR